MPTRIVTRISEKVGVEAVSSHRRLVAVLGVGLIALGLLAFTAPTMSAAVSVKMAGWLLLAAGAVQVAAGDARHGRVAGVANLLVGLLFLANPYASLLTLSLALATAYMVVGPYKAFMAFRDRRAHWPWIVAVGALVAAFGLMIALHWPETSMKVLGRFVGIQLIVEGVTTLMLFRPAGPRITMAPPSAQKGPVPR